MKAPDFNLLDQTGARHTLGDYAGKWLVLYFYPKDDTPGCTTEACSFRDEYAYLQELGLNIIGISKDSVKSHAKFAEKFNLQFPLLADEDHAVTEAYDAWGERSLYGRKFMGTLRTTVLINPEGEIVKTYPNVTPKDHAVAIAKDFEAMAAA